jgi:hypothetical protein
LKITEISMTEAQAHFQKAALHQIRLPGTS